jgi:hypothetical protein
VLRTVKLAADIDLDGIGYEGWLAIYRRVAADRRINWSLLVQEATFRRDRHLERNVDDAGVSRMNQLKGLEGIGWSNCQSVRQAAAKSRDHPCSLS